MTTLSDAALSALLNSLANDNSFSDYTRGGMRRAGALLDQLRAERVQLQAENESLRADLRTAAVDFGMWLTTRPTVIEVGAPVSVYAMNEALQEYEQMLAGRDTATRYMQGEDADAPVEAPKDKTDIETLCERLAKVEDRLAGAFTTDTLRKRFDEIATVLKAHEECLTTNLGYPKRQPLTPEQRGTFGRGDEVRLDMAQTRGGRRIFGWYVVEAIRTDISGYTVQVSAPEKPDPKPLFWIKPEDVLEVRKPNR